MSGSSLSTGTHTPADLFEDLWKQLRDCHQNALQELEAKVSKLKKERCLDAQRLEVYYNRQHQLKEQNKTLQDTIGLLEERLHAGECDRLAVLEDKLKNNQEQNLNLIAKLNDERNSLQDENRKLHTELQILKMTRSQAQQTPPHEQEEGFIPDSPILTSSLPLANKLKKRRNVDKIQHVRYAEMPLPQANNSLFNAVKEEPAHNRGRAEVLVPNTCELDASQISNDVNLNQEEAVAETCGLELLFSKPHMKPATVAHQQELPWKLNARLKPYSSSPASTLISSPDSTTERSPSLLSRVSRLPDDGSSNKAKRKNEDSEPEVQEDDKQGIQEGQGEHKQPEQIKRTAAPLNNQSFSRQPSGSKVQLAQNGTSMQRPSDPCSPAFKKPSVRAEPNMDAVRKRRTPLQDLSASHRHGDGEETDRKCKVEPMWSIDPALELSMYESERRGDELKEDLCPGELADTDCTFISHSLLQHQGEHVQDKRVNVSGLGQKANDSLDMMFETSAHGEYKSFNSPHMGHSQPCDEDDDDDDDEEGEGGEDGEQDAHDDTLSRRRADRAGRPTFPHIAVIRKKDERRRLKGTTCKECEVYYANLPKEERQKKLSACSRHRFLYVPPCTPENFWEVGFPSTQTCIDRGYVREENTPKERTKRRQPFNALFSPKSK